jgi:ubiquinone biosynthesis protein
MAEGDLGRVQSPALEALGDRISRNLGRLAGAIGLAALVVGGSLLLFAQMGGWHHRLGEIMVVSGILGMLIIRIGAWLRDRGRR